MPSTQKALFLDKKFGNIAIKETEIYKPGPGEILIKVQASSLNPVDWGIQKYGIFIDNFPAVLGLDIAGDVEELGEGVIEFKKGDRVFVQGRFENRASGFQHYATAIASTVARIPRDWTYDQAAALPVVVTCAYIGLYNQIPYGLGIAPPISEATQGILAGTAIVILGGATSVGQIVIQFAKFSGFSPIFTTASLKNTEYLKSLGATDVLDRDLSSTELVTRIEQVYRAQPVKFVYDAVGAENTQQVGLDTLAPGGKMGTVLPIKVKVPEDKTLVPILGFMTEPQNIELLEDLYHDKISGWLDKGIIRPNNIEVLPNGLAGIPDGFARMEGGQVSGLKLVVHPQET